MGNLRFSTESRSPTVAAYNWSFVCRGRGSYDFSMFLGLLHPTVRQECDVELMMRYLMARGCTGSAEREIFKTEVRAGLLVAFAFFFTTVASKLKAATEHASQSSEAAINSLEWFATAIDDWDCANVVGGVDIDKKAKKKRAYLKKSKRRNECVPEKKIKAPGQKAAKGKDGQESLAVL